MGLTHCPPPRRRGAHCVVHVAGQGTGSPSSSCWRMFSALDGWENVGNAVLLVDIIISTSEAF